MDLKTRKLINSLKLINNLPKYGGGVESVKPITIDYESRIPTSDERMAERTPYDLSEPTNWENFNNNLGTVAANDDSGYGQLATGVLGVVNTNLNARYKGSVDDVYTNARAYNTSINGTPVTLRSTDRVDDQVQAEREKAPYTVLSSTAQGAATGAKFGGPYGGIFGGIAGFGLGFMTASDNISNAKDDARIAKDKITNSNVYELLSAETNTLLRRDSLKNSSYYNQFKNGKNSKMHTSDDDYGKYITSVNSAYGRIQTTPNARTQGGKDGEFIWKEGTMIGSKVKGTSKDENLTYLDDEDVVFSSKLKDENGTPLSKLAEYYYNSGNMAGLYQTEKKLKMIHDIQNLTGNKDFDGFYRSKYRKLPNFEYGTPIDETPTYITRGAGILMDIGRMIEAYKNKPYRPDYSVNSIDYQALRDANRAKYQLYPIQLLLLSGFYKGNRAIDLSGQPAGVRMSSKVGNYANYYSALNDAMMRLQQGNIGLTLGAANMALNSRYRQELANLDGRYKSDEAWFKNHGKYITNITDPVNNAFGQMSQLASDLNKIRQTNYMLNLFDQQGKRDDLELQLKYKR